MKGKMEQSSGNLLHKVRTISLSLLNAMDVSVLFCSKTHPRQNESTQI